MKMESLWDANAAYYDRFASAHSMYRRSSRILVNHAGIQPGMVVVDLGCGTGVSTSAILKKLKDKGRVIGVDISSNMLAIARARIKSKRARFYHAPAEELDSVITKPVDRIVCNCSFWQFQNKEKVIAAVSKLLKPDGLLLFNSYIDMDGLEVAPYSNSVIDLILEQKKSVLGGKSRSASGKRYPLAMGNGPSARRAAQKSPYKSEIIDIRRYGLKVTPLKEYEIELSTRERLAFYRIPCMGSFLSDLTQEQREMVLEAAEKNLKTKKSVALRAGLWGPHGCLPQTVKPSKRIINTVSLPCTVLAIAHSDSG